MNAKLLLIKLGPDHRVALQYDCDVPVPSEFCDRGLYTSDRSFLATIRELGFEVRFDLDGAETLALVPITSVQDLTLRCY